MSKARPYIIGADGRDVDLTQEQADRLVIDTRKEEECAMTYDRRTAYEQGYEDAQNGFPRAYGMGAMYRQGYDKGLSDAIASAREE